MAAWGFTEADYSPEQRQALHDESVFEVWPDNWRVVEVFDFLGTQWNVGPGGPVGLRYESFREARLRFGIPAGEWRELVDDLRVMEDAALEEMHAAKDSDGN